MSSWLVVSFLKSPGAGAVARLSSRALQCLLGALLDSRATAPLGRVVVPQGVLSLGVFAMAP